MHQPGWSIRGAGVQFPGQPVDFVFGFQGMSLSLSLSAVMHAPFHASVLRPTVDPMHETAGMGELINAALLSLMRCV